MTKEDLIKLAEIAGYDYKIIYRSQWDRLCKNEQIEMYFKEWQPDKDIAQAFEVLEGMLWEAETTMDEDGSISYHVSVIKEVDKGYMYYQSNFQDNLPIAISQ